MKEITSYGLSLGGNLLNKFFIFQCLSASAFSFSGAVLKLITQEIVIGYSLLILGYYLLRKSDKENNEIMYLNEYEKSSTSEKISKSMDCFIRDIGCTYICSRYSLLSL